MSWPVVAIIALCGLVAALPPVLWLFYRAVMALKDARDDGKLSPARLQLAGFVLALGYIVDAVCNVVSVSLIFLDTPAELTVTARIKRYVNGPDGWRRSLAWWVAVVLLNPYSRQPHISLPTDRPAPAGFFTPGASQ